MTQFYNDGGQRKNSHITTYKVMWLLWFCNKIAFTVQYDSFYDVI